MWSQMFCPSQANPLPSFEDTLGTVLRKSSTVVVTVDPPLPGAPSSPPPTSPSAQNAAADSTTLGLPDWDQILSPSQFQGARCSPEAPFFAPPTSLPPASLMTLSPALDKIPPIAPTTSPTPNEVWKCDFCEKQFANAADCDAHLAEVHLFSLEPVESLSSPPTASAAPSTVPSPNTGA
ncbi:hypothetical protein JTE90_002357 [Oedothorax gibbosus]|uniref:C2H2-type domain-containing protein n=1 Tax=Oedothorax gibbosus TaxID=931172 RepID=A0AAV6ULK7_9ARAC|nr:hypothetical protein JTE90_002357 [Oedothorax gibbosus]